VVGRCLKTSPSERWQSAADLVIELNSIGSGKQRKRLVAVGAVIATVAAGALILRAVDPREPAAEEQVLYTFTNQNGDGANSPASVVAGKTGCLYGSTTHGGAFGKGTIYEVRPPMSHRTAWTESVLYSFTGKTDGAEPFPGLTAGGNGALRRDRERRGFRKGNRVRIDAAGFFG